MAIHSQRRQSSRFPDISNAEETAKKLSSSRKNSTKKMIRRKPDSEVALLTVAGSPPKIPPFERSATKRADG